MPYEDNIRFASSTESKVQQLLMLAKPKRLSDCDGDADYEEDSYLDLEGRSDDDASEKTPLIPKGKGKQLDEPVDRFKMVCIIFCFLGMSTMLPWNFLLSISSFWDYKFRNSSLDHLVEPDGPRPKPTELQVAFPSYLAIASNIPGAITTITHTIFGQRISVRTRMTCSLCAVFLCFVAMLSLSVPNSDAWQSSFLQSALAIIVLTNVSVNVLQGSLFGVSGRFPAMYAGYVMTGQALGGVLPAVAAIALISLQVEPRVLGPACFGSMLVFIGLALLALRWMSRNEFFLYYGEGVRVGNDGADRETAAEKVSYGEVIKRGWTYFLVGYLNYGTTLCVFPALTALVESQTHNWFTTRYFTPLACVLLFNVGDLVGRTLATWFRWPGRKGPERFGLLAFTILRLALIPLFMLCNAAPAHRTLPVVISSDWGFCLLMATLAVSTGYIGNICMIHAPKRMKIPVYREAISICMNSSIVFGIATGSAVSLLIQKSI